MLYQIAHKGGSKIKGRQLELLIYLLKYKKTTYRELAQHFEVSMKTVERDIDRLSSMGIPVYCVRGVGGGVLLDENYKFSTSFFTDADIHQMILALKVADSFSKKPKKEAIIHKLCLIAPELSTLLEQDMEQYLNIDLVSEKIDMETPICEKINECLNEEVWAKINDKILVAAIGYVVKWDGLHLFGFTDRYQLIRVADIATIELTDIPFERNFMTYEEYKKNSR